MYHDYILYFIIYFLLINISFHEFLWFIIILASALCRFGFTFLCLLKVILIFMFIEALLLLRVCIDRFSFLVYADRFLFMRLNRIYQIITFFIWDLYVFFHYVLNASIILSHIFLSLIYYNYHFYIRYVFN